MTPLFISGKDGWQRDEWRKRCLTNAQTLTLFKSKKGNIAAGYLHRMWEKRSNSYFGGLLQNNARLPDPEAFVLSITNKRKLTPSSPTAEVTFFSDDTGPYFGPWSLSVSS